MKTIKTLLAIATAALVATIAVPVSAAAGDPNGPPDVREVFLSHSDDGSYRAWQIDATIRRAESVTFRTRFAGDRAAAPGRQTQGHGRNYWISRGGHDLIPLVREALDARGYAEVGIVARGPAGRDRVRVRFALADCHMDPPFYPLSCSVSV